MYSTSSTMYSTASNMYGHTIQGGPNFSTSSKMTSSLKRRIRTESSDSGCDAGYENIDLTSTTSSSVLDDTLTSWTARLESVLQQEIVRAQQTTEDAKNSLFFAEDDERRESVLSAWKKKMHNIMDFTVDLIECVNIDTKDWMEEGSGRCSGNESPLEDVEEEEDNDEEGEEAEYAQEIREESKDWFKNLQVPVLVEVKTTIEDESENKENEMEETAKLIEEKLESMLEKEMEQEEQIDRMEQDCQMKIQEKVVKRIEEKMEKKLLDILEEKKLREEEKKEMENEKLLKKLETILEQDIKNRTDFLEHEIDVELSNKRKEDDEFKQKLLDIFEKEKIEKEELLNEEEQELLKQEVLERILQVLEEYDTRTEEYYYQGDTLVEKSVHETHREGLVDDLYADWKVEEGALGDEEKSDLVSEDVDLYGRFRVMKVEDEYLQDEVRDIFPSSSRELWGRRRRERRRRRRNSVWRDYLNAYKEHKFKTRKQMDEMCIRLRNHEIIQRDIVRGRHNSMPDIFPSVFTQKIKMFKSIFDQEDIFEDWRHNLNEPEEMEDIFQDWRQNLKEYEESEDIFQDWRWNLKEYEESEDIFQDWRWNLRSEDDNFPRLLSRASSVENWNQFWRKFWKLREENMLLEVEVESSLEACFEDALIPAEDFRPAYNILDDQDDEGYEEVAGDPNDEGYEELPETGFISEEELIRLNTETVREYTVGTSTPISESRKDDWGSLIWDVSGDSDINFQLQELEEKQDQELETLRPQNSGKVQEPSMGCEEVEKNVQGGSEGLDNDKKKETSWGFNKKSYWCNNDENKEILLELVNVEPVSRKRKREEFEEDMEEDDIKAILNKSMIESNEVASDDLIPYDDEEQNTTPYLVFWEDSSRDEINKDEALIQDSLDKPFENSEEPDLIFWEDNSRNSYVDLISFNEDGINLSDLIKDTSYNIFWESSTPSASVQEPERGEFDNFVEERSKMANWGNKMVEKSKMAANITDLLTGEDDPACVCENGIFWPEPGSNNPEHACCWWENEGKCAPDVFESRRTPKKLQTLSLDKITREELSQNFEEWRESFHKGKRLREKGEDIDDIFWDIENSKASDLCTEIKNLPFWDSPDVFADSCDLIESDRPYSPPHAFAKDPANIFRTWRYLFNEPARYYRTTRGTRRQGTPSGSTNSTDLANPETPEKFEVMMEDRGRRRIKENSDKKRTQTKKDWIMMKMKLEKEFDAEIDRDEKSKDSNTSSVTAKVQKYEIKPKKVRRIEDVRRDKRSKNRPNYKVDDKQPHRRF